MKRKIFIVLLSFLLFGCATPQEFYDSQTGQVVRNVDVDIATPSAVAINAGVGGAVGCGVGAAIGAVVGDPVGGCAALGTAGAVMGASSTQRRTIVRQSPQVVQAYPEQQGYANMPAPQQGYVNQPANPNSECTDGYRLAKKEITAIYEKKKDEAANYLAETGDNEGTAKIKEDARMQNMNSLNASLVRYQNCITRIVVPPQYAPQQQPQQVIIQSPPVIYSQPAINFPQVPYYGGYYDYYGYRQPYYGDYGYNPYWHRPYYGGYGYSHHHYGGWGGRRW